MAFTTCVASQFPHSTGFVVPFRDFLVIPFPETSAILRHKIGYYLFGFCETMSGFSVKCLVGFRRYPHFSSANRSKVGLNGFRNGERSPENVWDSNDITWDSISVSLNTETRGIPLRRLSLPFGRFMAAQFNWDLPDISNRRISDNLVIP